MQGKISIPLKVSAKTKCVILRGDVVPNNYDFLPISLEAINFAQYIYYGIDIIS